MPSFLSHRMKITPISQQCHPERQSITPHSELTRREMLSSSSFLESWFEMSLIDSCSEWLFPSWWQWFRNWQKYVFNTLIYNIINNQVLASWSNKSGEGYACCPVPSLLFASCLLCWLPLPCAPASVMFCLTMHPQSRQSMTMDYFELWAKINPSCIKFTFVRYSFPVIT